MATVSATKLQTPRTDTSPLSICLVSPVSGAANGGTAAYIRYLGNHLVTAGQTVCGISRIHTDVGRTLAFADSDVKTQPEVAFEGWRTHLFAPPSQMQFPLKRLVSLMTRPALRPLAHRIADIAYAPAFVTHLPSSLDVVHYIGTGWEMVGYSALRAARKRNAAFTVTPFVHPGGWGDSPLDVAFYNAADAVFVCTDKEREHLRSCGVRENVFCKTGLGPASQEVGDAKRFRERHKLGNRPLILFLGRKKRYKGFHVLREALNDVVRVIPDVCFMAAGPEGDSPYPPVPEGNFLNLGVVDGQHKADALAACDIYAMPSTGEAFGIVYTEAWAYGKPVIGGMAPALEELIQEDVNGYRVPQERKAVADVLIRLLQDESLRARLGKAGYLYQQQNFTWEIVVQTHIDVFRNIRKQHQHDAKGHH